LLPVLAADSGGIVEIIDEFVDKNKIESGSRADGEFEPRGDTSRAVRCADRFFSMVDVLATYIAASSGLRPDLCP
jgi:hypothetical protein